MLKFIKKNFITGIILLLPSVITFFTLYKLFIWVDGFLGTPIRKFTGYNIPGVGFFLTALLILFIGMLATNFIGRKVLSTFDSFLTNIPLVRTIYRTVKQIVDAFSQQSNNAFKRVVLIEYPRKGIYVLAFETGTMKGEIESKIQEDLVNIFLPTTPNPTSGFLLLLPRRDVTFLDMSVEDGLKLIISGGVISAPTDYRTVTENQLT